MTVYNKKCIIKKVFSYLWLYFITEMQTLPGHWKSNSPKSLGQPNLQKLSCKASVSEKTNTDNDECIHCKQNTSERNTIQKLPLYAHSVI